VLGSAAAVYGPAVLAVVLSGRLEDGAVGVRQVKLAGGRVIVQHPATAAHPSMPRAALATGCVDACLPPRALGDAIRAFVGVPGAAALFSSRPVPWAWPTLVSNALG
jgi:two-component system chemotaxis response regulator CheB